MAKLAIDQIECSAAIQVRVKIDPAVVNEYAEAIKGGAIFPALTIFTPRNSQRYLLADGFHRIAALKKLERKTVGVDVHEGGVHEALHYALQANAEHGLRRTNADKRNAVMLAFKDPHYDKCSLREIGDLCHVSKNLVNTLKLEQNKKASKKGVLKDSDKPQPRPRKDSPSQESCDREDLMGTLAIISSFPYDGTAAYAKLELVSVMDKIKFCARWLDEVLDAHEAAEKE